MWQCFNITLGLKKVLKSSVNYCFIRYIDIDIDRQIDIDIDIDIDRQIDIDIENKT